jgi:hypothetical protein
MDSFNLKVWLMEHLKIARTRPQIVEFVELPDFFEQTLNRVNEALPKAQAAFADISRRVDIRKAVDGELSDLEEEGWRLYESTKETLLLAGLDQCRYLFGRLNSRKEFRKA